MTSSEKRDAEQAVRLAHDLPCERRLQQEINAQRRLEDLRAEARYHRERHELYRAKVFAVRPTSLAPPLLERARELAAARLCRAEREQANAIRPAQLAAA